MTRIFIIRHGETEGNQKKIFRGRWDLPLNQHGQEQVRRVGEALKDIRLDALYTSPLLRARQTASAVAAGQPGLEPLVEEALTDIDFGRWTQRPDAEVKESDAELHLRWQTSPHQVVFPGGESLAQVRERVAPALPRLLDKHSGATIALASHRVPIKVLLCVALGLDDSAFWRIQVDTASIQALEAREGAFIVLFCNETCHLRSLGEKFQAADF